MGARKFRGTGVFRPVHSSDHRSSGVEVVSEHLGEKATKRLARRAARGRKFIAANSVHTVARHRRDVGAINSKLTDKSISGKKRCRIDCTTQSCSMDTQVLSIGKETVISSDDESVSVMQATVPANQKPPHKRIRRVKFAATVDFQPRGHTPRPHQTLDNVCTQDESRPPRAAHAASAGEAEIQSPPFELTTSPNVLPSSPSAGHQHHYGKVVLAISSTSNLAISSTSNSKSCMPAASVSRQCGDTGTQPNAIATVSPLEEQPANTANQIVTAVRAELPLTFQVPVPPDCPAPLRKIQESCEKLQIEPLPTDVVTSSVTPPFEEVCFYVEHLRLANGLLPCKACGEGFIAGQIRIGYLPSGLDPRSHLSVRWLHAPRCIRREGVAVRPGIDKVSFSPRLFASDRERILRALVAASHGALESSYTYHPILWLHSPALYQKWSTCSIPGSRAPTFLADSLSSSSSSCSSSLYFSPPVALSEAAVAARAIIANPARLRREALIARHHAEHTENPMRQVRPDRCAPNVSVLATSTVDTVSASAALHRARQLFRQQQQQLHRATAQNDAGSNPRDTAKNRRIAVVKELLRCAPARRLVESLEDSCVICRDQMFSDEEIRQLPCFHTFHRGCLERWIYVKGRCPLCNLDIKDMMVQHRNCTIGATAT